MIWNSFSLSNIKSPKTSQIVTNETVQRESVVTVNFWVPPSIQNSAHDSSLENYLSLVIFWIIKKFIWLTKLGYNLIFPRSLQRCINSPKTISFLECLQNNDTYVKDEGCVSYLVCCRQKPLSVFLNSSFIAQKHHLSETYPNVWDKGFAEMKRNEGDWELLSSWGKFGRYGGMLGIRGKWNLRNWVRGRGPKNAKHRPNRRKFPGCR